MAAACVLTVASLLPVAAAQRHGRETNQQPVPAPPQALSVEDEVVQNITSQPVGRGTLADYHLPEEFLRRFADRIIRDTYRRRMHRVESRPGDIAGKNALPNPGNSDPHATDKTEPKIVRHILPDDHLESWKQLLQQRPPLRGFRSPLPLNSEADWPVNPPDDPGLAAAAHHVAKRLAVDGLIKTTIDVVQLAGADRFVECGPADIELLKAVGLPVDLLDHFVVDEQRGAASLAAYFALHLRDPSTPVDEKELASRVRFEFQPARRSFRVATESGEHDPGTLRFQLTRGTPWGAIGSGGELDVARQVMTAFPTSHAVISVQEGHVEQLLETMKTWPSFGGADLSIIAEPLPLSQWAQDNGKVGMIRDARGEDRMTLLVPRFASRREDGSEFIPGETLLLDGLHQAGYPIVQSSLLFQGGDLIPITLVDGTRALLMGEAEVHRNTALGLNESQVLEAFTSEFGVDRCVVLPSISFHIDYDVCIRTVNGKCLAFVNDDLAAARKIVEHCAAALRAKGWLDEAQLNGVLAVLRGGNVRELPGILGPVFADAALDVGLFRTAFAEALAASEADSGVGNLHRFLVALDLLLAVHLEIEEISSDRVARAYFQSLKRRQADRSRLRAILQGLGCQLVPIPSLAEADRSINYINGIHTRSAYLMPAYGGLFAPLDELASHHFTSAFGDEVDLVPILCAETQRRNGAVHCAVSVAPATPLAGEAKPIEKAAEPE